MKQIVIRAPLAYHSDSFDDLSRLAVGTKGMVEPGLYEAFPGMRLESSTCAIRVVTRKKDQAISQLIRDNTQGQWEPGDIWHLMQAVVQLRGRTLPLVAFPINALIEEPENFPTLTEPGYHRQLGSWSKVDILNNPQAHFLFVQRVY